MQSKDRSIEARRNLQQQANYLQEVQERKRMSRPEQTSAGGSEMERILALSIQKAKEKITNLDTSLQKSVDPMIASRCEEHFASVNTVESRDVMKNSSQVTIGLPSRNQSLLSGTDGTNSSSVANAMKCLQLKIQQLQGKLDATNRQKQQLQLNLSKLKDEHDNQRRQLDSYRQNNHQLTQQKVNLQRQLETFRKTLQEHGRSSSKSRQEAGSLVKNLRQQLNQANQTIEKLRQDLVEKQVRMETSSRQQQLIDSKLRNKQKQLDRRLSEVADLEKEVLRKERQLEEQKREMDDKKNMSGSFGPVHSLQDELMTANERILNLQSVNELNKALIIKLESELEVSRQNQSERDQWMSREVEQAYIEKINQLQQELSKMKHNNKTAANQKLHSLKLDHEKLRDLYDNLQLRFEKVQEGRNVAESQSKQFRRKFLQVKEIMREFTDRVRELPNALTAQMKYLLTRASKISDGTHLSHNRSGRVLSNSSEKLSRSGRSNRLRSTDSKDKSTRKRKVLKMEDLNSSRNSRTSVQSATRSRVLQEYKEHTSQKSDKKSIKSRKSTEVLTNAKLKESAISDHSKLINMTDRELGLEAQINQLQKKMLAIKKQIKKLCESREPLDETEEEDRRHKKNELMTELQLKTEELDYLKKKKKKEERG